jgi:hypothetical protein
MWHQISNMFAMFQLSATYDRLVRPKATQEGKINRVVRQSNESDDREAEALGTDGGGDVNIEGTASTSVGS